MPFIRGPSYFRRVLGLFLAAALIPVLALSAVLTGIAASALERAGDERGQAAAETFAGTFRQLSTGVDRSLALVTASPEAAAVLAGAGDPAALGQLIAREASREEGLAFGFASADGGFTFATRDVPGDWDPRIYGGWGFFRKANASADTAFSARRRVAKNGEVFLIVASRSLRDAEGRVVAYAIAEIERSVLVRAARPAGTGLAADFELADDSGLVAFNSSDPSREGLFGDELPPRSPRRGPGRRTEAEAADARIYAADASRGFSATASIPGSLIGELTSTMRSATIAGLWACAAVAVILALVASRIVTGPVLALSKAMRSLRDGDLSVRLKPASDDELGALARSFNETAGELDRLVRETVEDQELLRKAELRALAARMNPHFLYNSLNSIRSLAKLGRGDQIVEVVARLGKLLRASADNRAELSTVGAGLEFVRHYLAVESIRFGERFRFEESVDPEIEDCELPSLVLEPLAENALTHGLELKAGKGTLRIEGRRVPAPGGADVVVSFLDDGPGAPEALVAELARRLELAELPPEGSGLGLSATNRRLRLRYGPGYGLSVSAGADGAGFRVSLRVPYRRAT